MVRKRVVWQDPVIKEGWLPSSMREKVPEFSKNRLLVKVEGGMAVMPVCLPMEVSMDECPLGVHSL